MATAEPLLFRIAAGSSEFEAIFRLNYETFVEEIPQHPPNPERRLIDRFHAENTYLVAVAGGEVVGMIAMRGQRPFSLDDKLPNLDAHLPPGRRVCELRLLAVTPAYRRGAVFRGLVDLVVRHGRAQGYDLAVISGTVRQLRLYSHLGFVPFGPRVGAADATFQPMFLTFERFQASAPAFVSTAEPVSFLPGPVEVAAEVRAAFSRPPAYHRDAQFARELRETKARLCALVGARRVEILLGSGTLANDVIGAQISLLDSPGVVVANGEFGDRLIDHAARLGLDATPLRFRWGAPLDLDRIEHLAAAAGARWLWAVVSETSTGMLNDLHGLKAIARRRELSLCIDGVSAIGAVPIDLAGVWLASGSSGKALAGLPGLSFVFHAHEVASQPGRLPRYLDLGYYTDKDGVPFTHSSNLVAALDAALQRFETGAPFTDLAARAAHLRHHLARLGLPVVVDAAAATPAIVTIAVPPPERAPAVGAWLEARGLRTAYQSEYLAARNWLQIGVMGACTFAHLDRLIEALAARPAARAEERNDASIDRGAHRGRAAVAAPASLGRQAPLY